MKFTKKESDFLVKNDFIFDIPTEFFTLTSEHYEITIDKEDNDCFNYYNDVDGSDLNRANNNESKLDLTWNELINLI